MNKKILGIMSLVVFAGTFAMPVLAQTISVTPTSPPSYTASQALGIIGTLINYAFGFLLAVAVLMLIFAAYLYVTAGGNPETVGKANKMLMYALIGIAIAVIVRGLIALVGALLGQSISI
ncbi:hypothetical protein KJ616_00255 [Patescibacteria group bacterium]|nr:hypothetical protein [Patescibacteria group bacterium]